MALFQRRNIVVAEEARAKMNPTDGRRDEPSTGADLAFFTTTGMNPPKVRDA
jgi:hypothetical protein